MSWEVAIRAAGDAAWLGILGAGLLIAHGVVCKKEYFIKAGEALVLLAALASMLRLLLPGLSWAVGYLAGRGNP